MTIRNRKLLLTLLLALALILPVKRSEAIIPAVAGWLLSIGGNAVMITDLVAGMTGLIAGALWYDCNQFSASPVCTNKPASMPLSDAPAHGLTVQLAPDAVRPNPDPTKFNDPVPPSRDVTPKSTQPMTPGAAPNYSDDSGSGGGKYWVAGPMGSVTGGSAHGTALQALSVNYCVGGYATECELKNCVAGSVDVGLPEPRATYKCEGWAKPGTMSCSPNSTTGKCLVGYQNQYTSSTQITGTPSKVCPVGEYSLSNGPCTAYDPGPATCPPGYTQSGTSCNLTDASAVKKPSNTPCQILYDASSRSMMIDNANPNCDGAAELVGGIMKVPNSSTDPSQGSMQIQPNVAGGFDFSKTDGQGNGIVVSTGPYDAVGGGYPITGTSTTATGGGDPNGAGVGCGIPGKPACNVSLSADSGSDGASGTARDGITAANNSLKGLLDDVDSDKFQWKFIPDIPTAMCTNPEVVIPIAGGTLTVNICGYFNAFSFFLNSVLAVLCLYGMARQIESASKA